MERENLYVVSVCLKNNVTTFLTPFPKRVIYAIDK